MIYANTYTNNATADYADFKAAFAALGGSKRTPVLYSAGLALAALEGVVLGVNYNTLPSTFLTDFPQAVAAPSLTTGG